MHRNIAGITRVGLVDANVRVRFDADIVCSGLQQLSFWGLGGFFPWSFHVAPNARGAVCRMNVRRRERGQTGAQTERHRRKRVEMRVGKVREMREERTKRDDKSYDPVTWFF